MHTLAVTLSLDQRRWRNFTRAVKQVLRRLNSNDQIICGPGGWDAPILTDETVTFNGNCHAHSWYKRNGSPAIHPSERDNAHEDFRFLRVATTTLTHGYRYIQTNTSGKPYGIAVRATHILAIHYFPRQAFISAANVPFARWIEAYDLARTVIPVVSMPHECRLLPTMMQYDPHKQAVQPLMSRV